MVIHTKKHRLPILLLLIGIICCISSAFISIYSSDSWFSRSGLILSFVSVAVQFILSSLKKAELENIFKQDLRLKEKVQLVKETDVMHEIISVVLFSTGLIGTLIWGYGDLLF